MAYVTGNIDLSSNFQLSKNSPLDARQTVGNNIDLNDIGGSPYDGLIVHVKDTDKTYVCIDETKAKDGDGVTDPGGVIDAAVWKEVGAAASADPTVTLDDQSSTPTGAADKVILYSDKEESAASLPNHLYLFDEGADGLVAVDWGRDSVLYAGGGTDGLKFNSTGGDYNYYSGSTIYGLFAAGTEPNVRVGGAAADYTLDGHTAGERADFEIQFQIGLDTLGGKTHTLISTDPPGHVVETAGFYWLGLYAASSEDDSFLMFQYYSGTPTALTTARWKIPGTLSTSDYRSTLALSFFEDDRSFSTTSIDPSVGKFRCYWNGSVLEDKDNAGVLHVAGSFAQLGKLNSANYPVYLGQFLDGDSSSGGVGFNPSLMFLEGKMHEFALYNHRCIHNTSDSYLAPSGPTRSVPLSVAKIADSDNVHSTILTTSNLGMLLPKSVEGLDEGSPWNDKGVVKIAPLTGDLDAVALDVDVITLPASSAAPAAAAGVAKIYSRLDVLDADLLLHFEDGVNDSSGEGNNASVIQGTPTYAVSTSGGSRNNATFGKAIDFRGAQAISFPDLGIGTGDFTVEFFVNFDNADTGVSVVLGYAGSAPGPGHFQIYRYDGVWYTLFWDHTLGTPAYTNPIPWTESLVDHTWYHVAFVKEGNDLSFYRDGIRVVHVTSHPVDFVIGGVETWAIGRIGNITTYQTWGQVDEFLITKTAKYSDATFVVPAAPYATKTNLYAMDGAGNEFKLTP